MIHLSFFRRKMITKKVKNAFFLKRVFYFKMACDGAVSIGNQVANRRKRPDLTVVQRQYIIDCSLRNLETDQHGHDEIDGKLIVRPGVARQLAIKSAVTRCTIHRVWNRACKAYYANDSMCCNFTQIF